MTTAACAGSVSSVLRNALEHANFRGWDPYDALTSPLLRRIARTPRLRQVAIQLMKRAPHGARSALGIPEQEHTKALAVLASAYARLGSADPTDTSARSTAVELTRRLERKAIVHEEGLGWGYDFDVQTRWGYYRFGQPNAVATAFAAHAFLDVAEFFPSARTSAADAAGYAATRLLRTSGPERYFAYYSESNTAIHNASMLVASALVRNGDSRHMPDAIAATEFTVARQRHDGSWPYGEHKGLGWIDGFHTAYVLWGLSVVDSLDPSLDLRKVIHRGVSFYIDRLFDKDGAPRATTERRFPIDVHAAASAVWALCELRKYHSAALPQAERVLSWALRNMRRRDGHVARPVCVSTSLRR
jgi:hypothetical protein